MTNIVEKKKVTEEVTKMVEVEKVVLTLDVDQAAFLGAILYNTTFDSLDLVPEMREVMYALTEYGSGIPFGKFSANLVSVERLPYDEED